MIKDYSTALNEFSPWRIQIVHIEQELPGRDSASARKQRGVDRPNAPRPLAA
jgi:hypothetical protein